MTESQKLLAEYAQSGSESAFRELVARYIGLVYSAARRLVDGDAHLAEDVAQTVFIDLARKAAGLSSGVMLGGWLHQRTYHVAAPMMRARRRREAREREAVEMNALQDNSGAVLAQIAPVLDEAITHLNAEDRTAILLRFFERNDFRSIGHALGTTDDAAQKRVTRALEKLHGLLKARGVTLSVAALGAGLAGESLTAAPAGLAATVAGAALASAVTGGTALTILQTITMTKLKVGIICAVVVAGVATPLAIQHQSESRLRAENESLKERVDQLGQALRDRYEAAGAGSQGSNALSDGQLHELLRLRGEVGALRSQKGELDKLKAENKRLAQMKASAGSASDGQAVDAVRATSVAKLGDARILILGMLMHTGDFPNEAVTNLDQVSAYIKPGPPDGFTGTNVFDMLPVGVFSKIPNPSEVIVIRERQAWQGSDGSWLRVYGFADGHSVVRRAADGNFDDFEKEHTYTPPAAEQQGN